MTHDSNELVLTREYPWNTKKKDLPDITVDGTVWLPDYLIRTTPIMVNKMKGKGLRYTAEDRRLKCVVVYANADSLKGKLILEERQKASVPAKARPKAVVNMVLEKRPKTVVK